ncbi:PREDICTED: piggyBac transposable element-derived protein 4-like [Priapulus caudatus]|uniref:PiggyBac transposable element-derived protein 4-like n=1 Tax=Priapulus caudatus TaxID=37621 RepID=A0ABM1EPD8_PRICU|nr:PREDICTED: piggyBac transposable element-derived protein 4-like [Priapulus caudatus]
MKKFLALFFLTGIISKPELELYWSTNEILSTPIFSKVMPRNRFEIIWSYFHVNDNEARPADDTDRLYKVRPVLDHLVTKFRELYNPGQNISIDEGMLLWRGRLTFRVYNPAKPVKYGIKSYILADSQSGYCWFLKPYCGVGATVGDTVVELLGRLVNQGYILYMDNYYNSVRLAHRLLDLDTHVCGTLRKFRGEPPEIRDLSNADLDVGGVVARHDGSVLCIGWRDKRIVKMVTTVHQDTMTEVHVRERGRADRVAKMKPTCITQYNASMNGVDRVDQNIQYYPFVRKSVKWTKKFVMYLFQIAIYNSFIIYKARNPQGKYKTLLDFTLDIIHSWITVHPDNDSSDNDSSDGGDDNDGGAQPVQHTPRAPARDPGTRLDKKAKKHVLSAIAGTIKKKYPSRRCRVCMRRGLRGETRYICQSCAVPLHKGECFATYHSTQKYY